MLQHRLRRFAYRSVLFPVPASSVRLLRVLNRRTRAFTRTSSAAFLTVRIKYDKIYTELTLLEIWGVPVSLPTKHAVQPSESGTANAQTPKRPITSTVQLPRRTSGVRSTRTALIRASLFLALAGVTVAVLSGCFQFSNPVDPRAADYQGYPSTSTSGSGGSATGTGGSTTPHYLYVAEGGSNQLAAYSIGSSGLTALSGSPYAGSSSIPYPNSIAIAPNGTYLYLSNYEDGVAVYSYNSSTGALTQISGSPFASAGTSLMDVAISPNGSFLYTADYAGSPGQVDGFTVSSSTGALTQISGSPFSTTSMYTSGIAITPNGSYLYASNGETGTATISAFSITSGSGALSLLTPSNYNVGTSPAGIAVSPNGSFLYVANYGSASISAFAIVTGGALNSIGTYTTDTDPEGIAISPNGAYLYASTYNYVDAFSIGSTGALSPLSPSDYSTGGTGGTGINGGGTNSITVSPDGTYLADAGPTGNSVAVFTVNSGTGALTAISGSPFSTGSASSPTGVLILP